MDLLLLKYAHEMEDTKGHDCSAPKCQYCGGADFIVIDYQRICESCQAIDPRYVPVITENFSNYTSCPRSKYYPIDNFKMCIQRYQGKENCLIPDEVYECLRGVKPTRESILKTLKGTKYYKNAHRIYFDLTGEYIDDIDHLESKLIQDYREFTRVYNTLEVDRKSFLNVQYVLFILLRRRGHPCKESNFNLPKTPASKNFHDEVCSVVFDKLGW